MRKLLLGFLFIPLFLGAQSDRNENPWSMYLSWGYNRSWHAPSDVQFETENGTFEIEKARASDRPSAFTFKNYFSPGHITIPQYNYKMGLIKTIPNGYWSVELGNDHMKWIFENQHDYKITGEYSGELWHPTEEGPQAEDFAYFKENGKADFMEFEYSDGHNYVFLAGGYGRDLYTSPNGVFKLNGGLETGLGLYVPRPFAKLYDSVGKYAGKNGEFQIAGYGLHAGVRAKATFYDRIYIETSLREIGIRNSSEFYSPVRMTTHHSGLMRSTQWYTGIGIILFSF